jgi:hypothetical protein
VSTDPRDLLRDGIAEFRVPAGLGVRAYGRWRRRRAWHRVLCGGATAGLAVVIAGSLTAAGNPFGAGSPSPAASAPSYVPPGNSATLVEYTTTAYPRGSGSGLGAPSQPGWGGKPRYTKPVVVQRNYRGQSVATFYPRPGVKMFTEATSVTKTKTVATGVTFSNHTWWHQVEPNYRNGPNVWCTRYGTPDPDPVDVAGGSWEQTVASLLKCRYVRVNRSSARIDGQPTIELSQPPATVQHKHSAATLGKTGRAWAVWVSPTTYLPLRMALWSDLASAGPMTQETEFKWLRPTKADLAPFHLTVPPGYKKVSPPVG